jgi:dihydrofolate synthase/folylpolyglutamate synthase
MEYREARSLLDRLPRLEVKPGLSRTEHLLDALGHPERGFLAVHVAGTNGKGSVVAMLDGVLRQAGYRVGRFTSPELIDFRDRISIDGEWLAEAEWAAGIARMEAALVDSSDRPTQFEAIAALAFDAFSRRKVDIALVEVGLGGRFDATNLVRPLVTIVCNVSFDHTAVLGGTLEQIAWEKAGIAKPGIPFLYGDLLPEAKTVVLAECDKAGGVPVSVCEIEVHRAEADWDAVRYRVDRTGFPEQVEMKLLGSYQRENLRFVLGAIEVLRECGFDVSEGALVEGLRTAQWPGRFEVFGRSPTVVLEGAHNVAAAHALAADVASFVPEKKRRSLVLGVLADKDVAGMVRALVPAFSRVALCRSSSPRALSVETLGRHVAALSATFACYHSVEQALDACVAASSPNGLVVVAGSLTVVSEARRRLVEGE